MRSKYFTAKLFHITKQYFTRQKAYFIEKSTSFEVLFSGFHVHNRCRLFCRYANFVCSIYLLRKFDMFFVSLKTRYDINLVAARRHIECFSTYRVIYDISKISHEIYIDEKATCRNKSLFLEAPPRFELGNQGVADPCLTTWL